MKHLGAVLAFCIVAVVVAFSVVVPLAVLGRINESSYIPYEVLANQELNEFMHEKSVSDIQGMDFAMPMNSNLGGAETMVFFPGIRNHFSGWWDEVPGIYIHRPGGASHYDTFYGNIHINPQNISFVDFDFIPVRWIDGVWQPTNWFSVTPHFNGMGVEFEFRKTLPAGRYAIQALAFENYLDSQGNIGRRPAMEWLDYEHPTQVMLSYEILYAEDLRYILARDGAGNNIISARGGGTRTINVTITTNPGAMDKGLMPARNVQGFMMGNMYLNPRVNLNGMNFGGGMEVTVERNGFVLPIGNDQLFDVWGWENLLTINIAGALPTGHYVVRISHPASDYVFGTFVLDNSIAFVEPLDMSGASASLFVLGTLLAVGAIILFIAPKVLLASQERRYSALQNQRYMTEGDGAHDDKVYKSQSAIGSLAGARERAGQTLDKSKSKGFLDTMRENRAKRELAREHGLTHEEFKEIEAKAKKSEQDKITGLAGFREAMEEHTGKKLITEKKEVEEKIKPIQDGDQVEILESVAFDAIIADEMLGQRAVQQNVQPGAGTILQSLRSIDTGGEHKTSAQGITKDKGTIITDTPIDQIANIPVIEEPPPLSRQSPIIDKPLVESPPPSIFTNTVPDKNPEVTIEEKKPEVIEKIEEDEEVPARSQFAQTGFKYRSSSEKPVQSSVASAMQSGDALFNKPSSFITSQPVAQDTSSMSTATTSGDMLLGKREKPKMSYSFGKKDDIYIDDEEDEEI